MSEKEQTKEEVKSKEAAKKEKVESRKTSSKAGKDQNARAPPMNYVMVVITAFNMGNGTGVTLKARGRAISTAVDVAEITRNQLLKGTKVHAISIGTEELTSREGGNPRNVSTMEISLTN